MEYLTKTKLLDGFPHQDFFRHAILECVSRMPEIKLNPSKATFSLELKIDGHAVALKPFFKHIEDQWDRMLAEGAMSLFKERHAKFSNLMTDFEEAFLEEARKSIPGFKQD